MVSGGFPLQGTKGDGVLVFQGKVEEQAVMKHFEQEQLQDRLTASDTIAMANALISAIPVMLARFVSDGLPAERVEAARKGAEYIRQRLGQIVSSNAKEFDRARSVMDFCITVYTSEELSGCFVGFMYKELNWLLRQVEYVPRVDYKAIVETIKAATKELWPWSALMAEGVKLMPPFSMQLTVYRGARLPRRLLPLWERIAADRRLICFPAWTSFSRKEERARGFIKPPCPEPAFDILFVLESLNRPTVVGLANSMVASEEEVLLHPFSAVRVLDMKAEGLIRVVRLRDVSLICRGMVQETDSPCMLRFRIENEPTLRQKVVQGVQTVREVLRMLGEEFQCEFSDMIAPNPAGPVALCPGDRMKDVLQVGVEYTLQKAGAAMKKDVGLPARVGDVMEQRLDPRVDTKTSFGPRPAVVASPPPRGRKGVDDQATLIERLDKLFGGGGTRAAPVFLPPPRSLKDLAPVFLPPGGVRHTVHTAASKGDVGALRNCLTDGGEAPNATDEHGNTPLHLAARGGHTEAIRLLTEETAELDAQNRRGSTALMLAVASKRGEAARALLTAGAKVDATRRTDRATALMFACQDGNVDAVTVLLERPAGVDLADSEGWTALHFAAAKGDRGIVERLLRAGASVGVRSKKGSTPLMVAAAHGRADVVDLLAGAEGGVQDNEGWTALHFAAQGGHARVIDRLVKSGVPVDPMLAEGWTPLHIAAQSARPAAVSRLLAAGANARAAAHNGRTVVHQAAVGGSGEVVQMLLRAGVDVNARSKNGQTPLNVAEEVGGKAAEVLAGAGAVR